MLKFNQIKQFFPANEPISARNMLREYLQYKVLDYIFSTKYSRQLSFIGGTAVRIIHGSDRFSEDLDFDQFGLTENEFCHLSEKVAQKLAGEGLTTELRFKFDGAFRCYLRFSGLLYQYGVTKHRLEKLLIQLDTTPQDYPIQPELKIINKFGVFAEVRVNPPEILLAQKVGAVLGRKRVMGRDLYDIVYLSSLAQPDYSYLKKKFALASAKEVQDALAKRLTGYKLKALASDILPFVSDENKLKVVGKFDQWLQTSFPTA